MKKVLFSLSLVALLAPAAAFAAMPNFIGQGYKQAADCVVPPDHGIYEFVGSQTVLTGCTPDADFRRAEAEAYARQVTGIKFKVNTSVTLKSGATETCPWWFIAEAGCIIAADLVR